MKVAEKSPPATETAGQMVCGVFPLRGFPAHAVIVLSTYWSGGVTCSTTGGLTPSFTGVSELTYQPRLVPSADQAPAKF